MTKGVRAILQGHSLVFLLPLLYLLIYGILLLIFYMQGLLGEYESKYVCLSTILASTA